MLPPIQFAYKDSISFDGFNCFMMLHGGNSAPVKHLFQENSTVRNFSILLNKISETCLHSETRSILTKLSIENCWRKMRIEEIKWNARFVYVTRIHRVKHCYKPSLKMWTVNQLKTINDQRQGEYLQPWQNGVFNYVLPFHFACRFTRETLNSNPVLAVPARRRN